MRLAFDVTPLAVPRTGIGNYMLGALAGVVREAAGAHDITAFALTDQAGSAVIARTLQDLDVELITRTIPVANVVRRTWSVSRRPALERWIGQFDALHLSAWWSPPQHGGIRATTIYDLIPVRAPDLVPWRTRLGHRAGYRQARDACDVVFAISEYTRDDAIRYLGLPEARLRIAHPGVDEVFTPEGPRADLGAPYVLSVATLEPRKNLAALLNAHALLEAEYVLAVVGASGWGEVPALDRPSIRRLGYVDDEQLAALYRGASALAFPSLLEGFGMPIVEAMACGCPVVASTHASLDEACGRAALRADPADTPRFADALREAITARERLAILGIEHASKFTWAATGRSFLAGLGGQ